MEIPLELLTYIDETGRMSRIPARLSKQRTMARWLATHFDSGRTYSEAEVNEVLLGFVDDFAFVRRLMISMGLMVRDAYGKAYELASV